MLRRSFATWRPPTFAPLPPAPVWHATFGSPRDRVWLHNFETATAVAEGFLRDVTTPKTIVEAYPGAGILTRALLQHPPSVVQKIIVLEDNEKCLPILKQLEEADPRVVVVPQSGFEWATYAALEAAGHMKDVQVKPWKDEAALQWIAHIPQSVRGEQLMSQLFRASPERAWLFKYGRVRMSCILAEGLHERVRAKWGAKARCKLSIIASATCDIDDAVPYESLRPAPSHFHPPAKTTKTSKASNVHQAAANFTPMVNQLIAKGDIDKWDYILRSMFIRKTNSLRKVLPSLCPGAENLLDLMSMPSIPEADRVDVNKLITNMTERDWEVVVKAFNAWPFAPTSLDG
ncbi:S-adenosyl-L-methionine-dependent methyltransferase [Exidia glandulosa HHB12029]|uniref:rRNA adenine N(6)-methyltransferase n=1 Tax=Exidia glandulosa HHB12029 TaxID=1314781 RepID=A0A165CI27_EXIGL|nr:S-adenosyl-L-methionine-dependent methyltransferase [Exidia glandulosa HHB12029]